MFQNPSSSFKFPIQVPSSSSMYTMRSFYWALSALSLPMGQAVGYLVSPTGVAAPGSSEDCTLWYLYQEGSTCEAVEVLYEISAAEFEEWVMK